MKTFSYSLEAEDTHEKFNTDERHNKKRADKTTNIYGYFNEEKSPKQFKSTEDDDKEGFPKYPPPEYNERTFNSEKRLHKIEKSRKEIEKRLPSVEESSDHDSNISFIRIQENPHYDYTESLARQKIYTSCVNTPSYYKIKKQSERGSWKWYLRKVCRKFLLENLIYLSRKI